MKKLYFTANLATTVFLKWRTFHSLLDPQMVTLNIDGTTDKCSLSEDINFEFTGFGIVGRVC